MMLVRLSRVGRSALVLCLMVPLSCCFNVDSRFALLKHSDSPGSLFGLSVALHQQTVGQNRYLMLVGAPKERAESTLKANQTGDMYFCPISTDPKDCTRANLVSKDPPESYEIVEGMWLGVSVVSQPQPGGRVMACGHRYKRDMEKVALRMIGKCYVLGNDLSYDPIKDYLWQYRYEVCDPNRDHSEEGMCMMGISAVISQTDVIVGAPGCYNWQGNSYFIDRNDKEVYNIQKWKFPNMNKGNMYIGYSVGKDRGLLSLEEETVVSGAPRNESKGSVVLAKSVLDVDTQSKLQIQATLTGEQVGSYFGNSIAIVDLNNDRWKELIVGAPFYFDRKKEEGGAVYVFKNENGFFSKEKRRVFTGPKNSGFGMAVAAIGDVNQDGFQDFAVGAPYYESGRVYIWMGSESGVSDKPSQVIEGKDITNGGFKTFGYSINGGLDVDNNRYPDMVVGSLDDRVALLRARPVIHLQKTLTVTPDIVSPENCDSCIEVKVCFSYTVSTGDPNFKKKITVQYTVEADLGQRLTRSRVQFVDNNKDTYTGFLSMPSASCDTLKLRVMSPIQNKVAPLEFSMNVSLFEPQPDASQQPQDLDAFPVIDQGEALTERKQIHFEIQCGPDNKCESNLQMTAAFSNTPVQDDHQVLLFNTTITKVTLLVNISNIPSSGRLAEDAYNSVLNITFPSSLQYSGIRSELSLQQLGHSRVQFVNNNKDTYTGFLSMLSASCDMLKLRVMSVQCQVEGVGLLCDLGNPFRSNQREQLGIIFETSGITLDTRQIDVVLQLSTLSSQDDLKPLTKVLMVEYTLETTIDVQPQEVRVEFGGEVVGESAMKSTADIGSPVQFHINVSLIGKPLGSLGFLQVLFDWPYQVENEKWLLYLVEIQMLGTSQSVCTPEGKIVNPLNLAVPKPNTSRRKRDEKSAVVHPEPQASLSPQSARRRNVQLSCGSGAKCQAFICPLHNMNKSAVLKVQARLWNSTMLEDYKDSDTRIKGQVTLQLKTDKPAIRMDNSSSTVPFSVVVNPAGQKEAQYEAPLWIIIVSVLAGVILLGLIIILLWKCGFFRRASTRELYEAKSQKAEMKMQPSETDRLTEEE